MQTATVHPLNVAPSTAVAALCPATLNSPFPSGESNIQRVGGLGRLGRLRAYSFAVVTTAATLGLRLALSDQLRDRPTLIIFTAPIILSAYAGGLEAGVLATALSCLGADYFLLPPFHTYRVESVVDRWDLFFLLLTGIAIGILNEALHRARRRADVATGALLARVALVEAAPLQHAISKSTNFLSIATDKKGVIQIFNVGAERTLGYSAAEVVNKLTPADISDPQELVARADALSREFGTTIAPGLETLVYKATRGMDYIYEPTLIRKDGSRFPAVMSVTALRDSQNEIIGYLLIGTDNTAHKQAEQARLASEKQYRTLFECAPDGILIADPQGYYVDANPAFCRMLGYTLGELVGLHASSIVALSEVLPGSGRINAQSKCEREWQFRRKDGSLVTAEVLAKMMPDGNLIEVIRDITQRKQDEARFHRLIDSNIQGVIFWNATGEITKANDAFLRTVGYTRDDLEAGLVNWSKLTPPEYADLDRRSLAELSATGICCPVEKEYIRKDGSRVPVMIGAATFEDDTTQGVCFVLDRTESRQAEAVAVRLAAIVESSTDAVFGLELNGTITSWNAAAEKIFGYTADEMLGCSVMRIIPPDRQADNEYIMSRVKRGERVEHFETRRVRKNGDVIYVSINASPVKDSRCRVIGVCGVVRDITEPKRAAVALQQSEAQLQTIIEHITEAVVVADLNGQLLHFNPAALNMMGYTSLDEGRRAMNDLTDTFELSSVDGVAWSVDQWPMARILRGERLNNLEARMRRIGTDWDHVYSFGGTLARDAAGNPLMAVVTFTDITHRQKAEAAAVLLAAIVRSSSDAIIGTDLNSIVTSWNGAAEAIFGYSAEEMLGQSIAVLVPPECLADEKRIQSRVKAGDRVEHFETERVRKNGDRIIVSVTVSPIRDAGGAVIGSSKSVRDVTAIKRAAAEIQQLNADLEHRVAERTAQLLTANRELEAFSYSVSHDLRAPLRSIDGFSKAILEDYSDKLDGAGQEHLRRVRMASQRMGQLIDDLLNLSRVSRGELRNEPTDLSQIARDVFEECQSTSQDRAVTIRIAPNLMCDADPQLMRIVLTNLISNAWKFTGNNPQAAIELGCNVVDGGEEYFVRDNGAGFDMTYVGKLFGAFQRLHSEKEFAGTGIGLATIKRIIQRHGGTVRAESKPGEGATFYFTLNNQSGSQTRALQSAA